MMALFGQPRLVMPGDVILTEEDARDLIGFAALVRDMRAAQRAYYAKNVPPTEKRDLLVAARQLEVAVDKALPAVLARYGAE